MNGKELQLVIRRRVIFQFIKQSAYLSTSCCVLAMQRSAEKVNLSCLWAIALQYLNSDLSIISINNSDMRSRRSCL
jgi:hypothetical protein